MANRAFKNHLFEFSFSIAFIKHRDQKQWGRNKPLGRRGFISFYSCSRSSREVKKGEPLGRNGWGGHGEVLLTSLLPKTCSVIFLLYPRTNCWRWHYPHWVGPLPIYHRLRKCTIGSSTGQSNREIFSFEVSSSQVTLACVKMT